MSRPKTPHLTKLIVSLITGNKEIIRPVLKKLEGRFGSLDFLSRRLEFNHTGYYKDEMGEHLIRKIASFERFIAPDKLPDIKLFTNSIEDEYLKENGGRIINIDPGYIAMEKLVLASCKNFTHRIYLRDGVYADLTLTYRKGSFRPLEWTFPDYGGEELLKLLKELRERYVCQLEYT